MIALGSNLGNRFSFLKKATSFLEQLSETPVRHASIYESEPIGISDIPFLNTAVAITTSLRPETLLDQLKRCERELGRDPDAPRWSNRVIDLDIIAMANLEVETPRLSLPHAEYKNRLFVLLPLRDLCPDFTDPADGIGVDELILAAPQIAIQKASLIW